MYNEISKLSAFRWNFDSGEVNIRKRQINQYRSTSTEKRLKATKNNYIPETQLDEIPTSKSDI